LKLSTIQNHTNKTLESNCTHLEAWSVAWTIRRWSIWNLVYWFRPPVLHSVSIIPENMDLVDPEDAFDQSMFRKGGFLADTRLNHYIRLLTDDGRYEFWVNAGVLYNEFMISRRRGFRALKELITCAKEELSKIIAAESSLSNVQEESVGDRGRDPSVPSGVNN